MTGQVAPKPFLTVEEFIRGEAESEVRHEYANGKPCKVTPGNLLLKLELNHADLLYYPDAMVWCDPDDDHPRFKTSPRVIVEVMSDYKKDHVEKLFAY